MNRKALYATLRDSSICGWSFTVPGVLDAETGKPCSAPTRLYRDIESVTAASAMFRLGDGGHEWHFEANCRHDDLAETFQVTLFAICLSCEGHMGNGFSVHEQEAEAYGSNRVWKKIYKMVSDLKAWTETDKGRAMATCEGASALRQIDEVMAT